MLGEIYICVSVGNEYRLTYHYRIFKFSYIKIGIVLKILYRPASICGMIMRVKMSIGRHIIIEFLNPQISKSVSV